MPKPAMNTMLPSQHRWAIHTGTCSRDIIQKKGPVGKRYPICSWVTVPKATFGSQTDADRMVQRAGSRYRYVFVSSETSPGLVSSMGT